MRLLLVICLLTFCSCTEQNPLRIGYKSEHCTFIFGDYVWMDYTTANLEEHIAAIAVSIELKFTVTPQQLLYTLRFLDVEIENKQRVICSNDFPILPSIGCYQNFGAQHLIKLAHYDSKEIQRGIYCHELVHMFLHVFTGSTDPGHKRITLWDSIRR